MALPDAIQHHTPFVQFLVGLAAVATHVSRTWSHSVVQLAAMSAHVSNAPVALSNAPGAFSNAPGYLGRASLRLRVLSGKNR